MSVVANGEYKFAPRDAVENFQGNYLLFACWDQHMLMAAPFMLFASPKDKLGDIIDAQLKPLMSPDPDFEKIDWNTIKWLKDNKPWTPDMNRTVEENGLGHKDQMRFTTPGLATLILGES